MYVYTLVPVHKCKACIVHMIYFELATISAIVKIIYAYTTDPAGPELEVR